MPQHATDTILSEVKSGEDVFISSFLSGYAINHRLASLGFTPGAKVKMVQNFMRGPLIVFIRGTRVALGRGEASKILVSRG